MRFSRPCAPEAICSDCGATSSAVASVASSSRLAAPSTARARTRTVMAAPWKPATPGREAPGRAWTRKMLPSGVGDTQPSGSGDTAGEDEQAPHDENLQEPDAEHDDQRREVD